MTMLACRFSAFLPVAGLVTGAAVWLAFQDTAVAETLANGGQHPSADTQHTSEGGTGFPQLNPATYPSQVFWLFVSFGVLYMLMSRIALPRITEVLDLRQSQKENNLNRAQNLQEDSEKISKEVEAALAKSHSQAQEAIQSAEDVISRNVTAETSRFAEHARTRIAAAETNIARAKQEALQSLSDIAAEAAVDIVQKVAAVGVTKADAKKAVGAVIEGAK